MDVTICVATFGCQEWANLALDRAIPSAQDECSRVVHTHGETLAGARNQALAGVETEFAIFLDADDQLEPGYAAAMSTGTADLRGPSVAYFRNGRRQEPYVPKVPGHTHDCSAPCLEDGNYLVIGSAVKADLLRSIGGFREEACYEDWSAWLRCHRAGATVETIPEAVYRAHVRPDSRNRAPSIEIKNRVHREIIASL